MIFEPVLPDGSVVRRGVPRAVWAFGALGAGLVVGRAMEGVSSAGMFGVAGLACVAAMLGRGVACRVALFAGVVCFGAAWFTIMLREPGADSLRRLLGGVGGGGAIVTVEGIVLDSPRVRRVESIWGERKGVRAEVSVRALVTDGGVMRARGRVHVKAGAPGKAGGVGGLPRAGERVRLTGVFSPEEGPRNPGEMDWRLCEADVAGWLRVSGLEGVVVRDESVEGMWIGPLLRARAWLADRARGLLLGDEDEREEGRALLGALILGEEESGLREARGAFNRLGLAHVLSISGFHIAVMTMVGLLLLRAAGDLGWVEPVIAGALIVVYLAVLPFNAPVWRSGLMVLGLLIGDALGRRYDRLALLAWIACALVLWRPMDLWSIGFQLSFGLVALLIWMGRPFHQRMFGMRLKGPRVAEPTWGASAAEGFRRLVSTNVLCCLGATPVVMYHTGMVSPLSVLSGVVMIPIITVVLVAGYGAMLLGVLVPELGGPAREAIAWLSEAAAFVVRWIDGWGWSAVRVPNVSLAWAVVATAVVLYWMARGHRRDWAGMGVLATVGVWLGAELWFEPTLPRDVGLRIDTLAVGDGTCHLVRSGREALLWDCGSLTPGVGRMMVPRAVRDLGAWRVPTVVITHPNLDHFNGVADVVEPLGVKRVLIGRAFEEHARQHSHSPEMALLAELGRRGVEVQVVGAGDRVEVGEYRVEFVSPPPGVEWAKDNDMSLVARVRGATGPGALLCGDVEDEGLGYARGRGVRAAIMEAPHHGSARGAAMQFVADLDPAVVLQSTGQSRAGDARWAAVRAGRTWLCTATDGACFAEIRRDGTVRAGRTVR